MGHGSREPVKQTCPDIDEMISLLEELRDSNSKLREWGEKEAGRVDELEDEVGEYDKQITDLNSEIEDLKFDIGELKAEIKDLQNANTHI